MFPSFLVTNSNKFIKTGASTKRPFTTTFEDNDLDGIVISGRINGSSQFRKKISRQGIVCRMEKLNITYTIFIFKLYVWLLHV